MNYLSLILFLLFLTVSCQTETPQTSSTTPEKEVSTTSETPAIDGQQEIDLNKSKLYWKGHKIMGYHSGSIRLNSATLAFDKGDIISGEFVVDMNSITVSELMDEGEHEEEEDEEPHDEKSELASHLMHEDFFDAPNYPTANFVIKDAKREGNQYSITGDMTIKGVRQTLTFDAQLEGTKITADISIDRTAFGIKYGSGSFFDNLGDRVINDKFDLQISLVFK